MRLIKYRENLCVQKRIKQFMKIPHNYYFPAMILLGYTPENVLIPKQTETNVNNKVHWNQW